MQPQDAQSRPWLKLMENVIKSYGQKNSDYQFNHQGLPHTPHWQPPQKPYQQPCNVPVKWPHEALPLQDYSIVMPEKIEFSLNLPLPCFPLFKGISITTKKSDDLRHSGISPPRFSRFQSRDGTGSRYMFDHKGFIKDPLKHKPSHDGAKPGLDFSLSAPIF
ncbi:hypothetical protein GOODEAATRI_024137 [Goodea atripinnis]|uniref:Uncharacterized protein n=1 Tax=Goodea atripinnis TaxID=208336 RepID=A0ABV0P7D9_9TELE